jgi:hypothetical protein
VAELILGNFEELSRHHAVKPLDDRALQQFGHPSKGIGYMNVMKLSIFLAAGMIAGSTVWSGCYTRLAIGSDNIAQEAESDSTAINQMAAINEIAQSVFVSDPWVIGSFAPFYFPPPSARTRFQKKSVVSAYRPLPFTGTPSVSNPAESQATSPHRQSGYQRSASPDQGSSRNVEPPPPRTSPSPTPTPSPSIPTTLTPTASTPASGTSTTSAPPVNNRAGGATRTGR